MQLCSFSLPGSYNSYWHRRLYWAFCRRTRFKTLAIQVRVGLAPQLRRATDLALFCSCLLLNISCLGFGPAA